jgi:hypothetical protein
MVHDTVIAPGVEMALVRDERRLVQLFELDRLQRCRYTPDRK